MYKKHHNCRYSCKSASKNCNTKAVEQMGCCSSSEVSPATYINKDQEEHNSNHSNIVTNQQQTVDKQIVQNTGTKKKTEQQHDIFIAATDNEQVLHSSLPTQPQQPQQNEEQSSENVTKSNDMNESPHVSSSQASNEVLPSHNHQNQSLFSQQPDHNSKLSPIDASVWESYKDHEDLRPEITKDTGLSRNRCDAM